MKPRIHVCIVTSAHPVDDVRVYHKFARTFIGEGFRVTWIGPNHSFTAATRREEDGIDFRLFPHRGGKLGRLLAHRTLFRNALAVSDVDVFYAPDPDSAPVAARLAGRGNGRTIFDIHEMYQSAMLRSWGIGPLTGMAGKIVQRQLLRVCSRCDLVVGVSRAVLEPYQETPTEKLIVRNCAPAYFAKGRPADVCHASRGTFTVMHGKMHMNRGTRTVLEALQLARKQVSGLKCILFDMSTVSADDPDRETVHRLAASLQIEDVIDWRASVSLLEMPEILRTCDVGLIAYGRELGVDSLPNRLFEYMAAGLPMIAPEYAVEIRRILHEDGCGLTADFESPSSVAAAIVELARAPERCREMGRRARRAFESRHNWEVEVRPLLNRIRTWSQA